MRTTLDRGCHNDPEQEFQSGSFGTDALAGR